MGPNGDLGPNVGPNLGQNWVQKLVKLGLSKPESGTFWASQILKVVSNPESGTFWASVSGQKALLGVNLVSQILKVVLFGLLKS